MSLYRTHYDELENSDQYDDLVSKHQGAMTSEDLHGKAEIARELAYRDYRIDQMQGQLDAMMAFSNQAAANQAWKDQLKELNSTSIDGIWGCFPDWHIRDGDIFVCCDVLEFANNDSFDFEFTGDTPEEAINAAYEAIMGGEVQS